MSYFAAFDISLSGMQVQKLRLDTVALNLANTNTTRSANGSGPYQPMQAIVAEKSGLRFSSLLQSYYAPGGIGGAEVVDIQPLSVEPKRVYDPQHPDADEKGFVAYPNINPVSEMMVMMEATRSYEANVKAFNAAKAMALQALEIGS